MRHVMRLIFTVDRLAAVAGELPRVFASDALLSCVRVHVMLILSLRAEWGRAVRLFAVSCKAVSRNVPPGRRTHGAVYNNNSPRSRIGATVSHGAMVSS